MEEQKKTKKENPHDRHKLRLRQKFLEKGDFSGFYDHEILEMLLSYSVVRGNTNETAHRLIDKFHSLNGVFEAEPEELIKVDGVGERSAALIKMQYELFRAYLTSKYEIKNKDYSVENVIPYLQGLFFGKRQEFLYMVCIDAKNKIIKSKFISNGINELQIDFRAILREVFVSDARGVVLAHNHPNGVLKASQADIETTRELEKYFKLIEVKLIDHFIFSDNDYISILNEHSFKLKKI